MADHADGSIIISTEIDKSGFDAGSDELQSALKSLTSEVNALGSMLKGVFSAPNASAQSLEAKIAAIKSQMAALEQQQIPTDDFKQLTSELERAEKHLITLLNNQERMETVGVDKTSRSWLNLQYNLEVAGKKYDELLAAKERAENDGSAYKVGAETEQYKKLAATLEDLKLKLENINNAGGPKISLKEKLGGALKSAASSMKSVELGSKSTSKNFSGLISGAKKFALSMLGARGVFALLRKAVNAYMAQNQELTNTLNGCWQGIGNLLGPIIERIVNLVARATAYVTSFLKLFGMFGTKVKSSAKAAANAAKEMKSYSLGIDELNVFDKNNESGSAANNAKLPTVEMPDWSVSIADSIKAGDWQKAAKTMANEVKKLISKVVETVKSFNFEDLGNAIGNFISTAINGLNWADLGVLFTSGLSSIIGLITGFITGLDGAALSLDIFNFLYGAIYGTDWMGLTQSLIFSINKFLGDVDLKSIGKMLSDGALEVLKCISIGISNFDWAQLGKDIGDFIIGIDWLGIVNGLIECGVMLAKGLLEGILYVFASIGSWLKENVFDPFVEGFKNLFGIHSPSTVMEGLGQNIIEGLLSGIKNFFDGIPKFFKEKLGDLKKLISDGWDNVGKNIVDGIADGISKGWNWLKEKVSSLARGLLDGVKNVLGIASPSKLFRDEVGLNIGYGIGEGIEAAEGSVLTNVSSLTDAIADRVTFSMPNVAGKLAPYSAAARAGAASSNANSDRDQIIDSIKAGVSVANDNVVAAIYALMNLIDEKDYATYIGDEQVGRSYDRYKKQRGVSVNSGAFANVY